MENQFTRTENLIGADSLLKLRKSHVAVFGIGGVGGYAAEALARSGIGKLTLVDSDKVSVSNINRQIIALNSTVGKYKIDVMKERIADINPDAEVTTSKQFFLPENSSEFDFSQFDYVVDAIDTVKAKIELVIKSKEANVPVISAMGAGNKLDPTKFEISDIYKTSVCPLAKVIRHELKKRKIKHLKVVFSEEYPVKQTNNEYNNIISCDNKIRKSVPSSYAPAPAVMGLIIASEVIKDLIQISDF